MEGVEARFLDKIDFSGAAAGSGCWEWTAAKDKDGYGRFGNYRERGMAHRWAWRLWRGEIPGRLQVLHTCDNPGCVNPDHLFLGTQAENMHDMKRKSRGRTLPAPGSQNGRAKLTEADVRRIRSVYVPGSPAFGCRALAREYGMFETTIYQAITRKTWRHVPD